MSRMTDAQFEQMYKLLKLCEKRKIDMRLRHRIAIEISHAKDIDLQLELFYSMISERVIPATEGIPVKISLLSDSQGYGPRPGDDEEVVQRVTIVDNGRVYITYYNYGNTVLRRERLHIDPVEAEELLQDINTTFAIQTDNTLVTDVGMWELRITNAEGRRFFFSGSLYPNRQSPLTNLSEKLRDILERPMLFCFDGDIKESYQFVSVCFDFAGKEYCYLADDRSLAVGDLVEVPVGDGDRKTTATVVAIKYCTADDAPYPVEYTKRILRKITPNLPENLEGSTFDIVKRVVDTMDPEGLLEMEAPQDEYDGESRVIADSIKADMDAKKIARLMAEEFSRSFADSFDANYFMVAAARIKEALDIYNKKQTTRK